MNRNLKIGLIVLGVGVLVVGGVFAYRKWRMTSGNATKDGRRVRLLRTSASQEEQLTNEAENTL